MTAIGKGTGISREEQRKAKMLERLVVTNAKPPKISLAQLKATMPKIKTPLAPQLLKKETGIAKPKPKPNPERKQRKQWLYLASCTETHVTLKTGEVYTRKDWKNLCARRTRLERLGIATSMYCWHCSAPLNNFDLEHYYLDCGPCRRAEESESKHRMSLTLTETEFAWLGERAAMLGDPKLTRQIYIRQILAELRAKEEVK